MPAVLVEPPSLLSAQPKKELVDLKGVRMLRSLIVLMRSTALYRLGGQLAVIFGF